MVCLRSLVAALAAVAIMMAPAASSATAPPSELATIIVHGFDPAGSQQSGVFGSDLSEDYIADLAGTLGLPSSTTAPLAMNQVAYTTYYGNQPPPYYTSQDVSDLQFVTGLYGGGVPRYAMIIGKFAKEVMRRSGAKQVNIFAVSFGGLISRYMIENDTEGLASSGKIARWISVEGVVAGNWAATFGGQLASDLFSEYYDAEAVDLQHMNYEWVKANIHNLRTSSSSPFFGQFPVHFWLASDDEFNNRALSFASQKANDGVVLIEDAYLHDLPAQSKYLGMNPTVSAMHTTHEGTKQFEGIRAGVAAQIFGRKRVKVTLEQARIRNEFDGSFRGDGEYVFGVRVFSPAAEAVYGITKPIHQLRSDDNNTPYYTMAQDTTVTLNQALFDDMVLPGETQLRLETNVDEIDGDIIYQIAEDTGEIHQDLKDTSTYVSVETNARYTLETDDWRGLIKVEVNELPPFDDGTTHTAAQDWNIYN